MPTEPTLLVVDDEDAICEGCRRIFSRQGFGVQKCCNATEGLDLAKRGNFTAILLDIKMPEMDGLNFLESLRKTNPAVPVVLMTGYPSIPNAASAVRLGASDYVTKPFTPEEISAAVHRLLHAENTGAESAAAPAVPAASAAPKAPLLFFRDAWHQMGEAGVARVGAMLVRPGATKIESLCLPRIGEVVYRGLPLAAVTVAGQTRHMVPAPLSGVVVEVNDALSADPSALLTDPCGRGWIAGISPTRYDEEADPTTQRRVILMSRDQATAGRQAEKLVALGCDVQLLADVKQLEQPSAKPEAAAVLIDEASFAAEGPAVVGAINTRNPGIKVIVLGATGSPLESAYRLRRIFYYAVEPFADNEIAEILAGAFQPPPCPAPAGHREFSQALGGISITNRNRTRVSLLAAPGLLRREDGLGQALRHKLMQARFPLEISPTQTDITPMNILREAAHCDRLFVLLVQDVGRLPGSLVRDTKAEYVALVGAGADRVTTLLVQPSGVEGSPLAFEPAVTEALAEHLAREMANC